MNRTYKVYSFLVSTANQVVNPEFDLEKNVKEVVGIALSSDMRDMLFYAGSQRMEIGGLEVFPEGYESNLLMAGVTTKPNDKFHTFDPPLPPGSGKIRVFFTDRTNAAVLNFTPYRVTLTVAYHVL